MSAGRGGTVFDEDPKRWRLIAEGFTTSGRALEIATAVFPQQFVLLAGVRGGVVGGWGGRVGGGGGEKGGGGKSLVVFAAALLEIATVVFPQQVVLLAGVLVTVSTKVGQARGRVGKGQKGGLGAGIWLCLQLQCCLFLPVILLHGMSL